MSVSPRIEYINLKGEEREYVNLKRGEEGGEREKKSEHRLELKESRRRHTHGNALFIAVHA